MYVRTYYACSLVPRPLPRFQCNITLKTWEWPGDEAIMRVRDIMGLTLFTGLQSR